MAVSPNTGQGESYAWLELAARIDQARTVRDRFVRVGDTAAVAAWRDEYHNTDVYASVCRFLGPDRSSAAICPFFLDIDAEDSLQAARDDTLRACALLIERLGIDPDSIELHFSGAKGFHLLLPLQVFGEPTDTGLIRLWQCLARRLAKEGLTHLDLGVYQTTRLLRLPNSVNSKTMLYKVPLEYKELRDLEMPDIIDLARAPRESESMAIPAESDRAVAWLADAKRWIARQDQQQQTRHTLTRERGWRTPPCIRRVEATVLPDGVRHQIYYILARFYATTGMAEQEAVDRLRELDRRHPIHDPDYVERVVHNAWSHPGFAGCPNPTLEPYCDRRGCFLMGADRCVPPNPVPDMQSQT